MSSGSFSIFEAGNDESASAIEESTVSSRERFGLSDRAKFTHFMLAFYCIKIASSVVWFQTEIPDPNRARESIVTRDMKRTTIPVALLVVVIPTTA